MKTQFKISYLLSFFSAIVAVVSLFLHGIWAWSFVIYAFGFIPAIELFFKGDTSNPSAADEVELKNKKSYDYLLYAIFYVQWVLVAIFIWQISTEGITSDLSARIFTLGITCGVFGINVAHELGHRTNEIAQFYAKGLLLSSLYMHFTIEHNKGHHTHVGTLADGATARRNEWLYVFWFRSVYFCYKGAWDIQLNELRKKGLSFFSWSNQMLKFHVLKLFMLIGIGLYWGWWVMFSFMAAAAVGFLLLETVNYVEHYGLMRAVKDNGKPVPVKPVHSWNSNHPIGRGLLFELSRHSDHHYRASRKYQVLRSFEESPIMPTGYPGMILMSLLPPLWFSVMNRQVDALKKLHPGELL